MKRLSITASGIAAAAAYFVLSALPAVGADNGALTARVTVASPCLLLNVSTIDFGVATFNRDGQPVVPVGNADALIENCNPTSQQLFVRGSHAVAADGSDTVWTLVAAPPCPTPDRYVLGNELRALGSGAPVGRPPGGFVTTTDTRFDFPTGGAFQMAGGTQFRIAQALVMPCAPSSGAGKTMTFDIIYTATN